MTKMVMTRLAPVDMALLNKGRWVHLTQQHPDCRVPFSSLQAATLPESFERTHRKPHLVQVMDEPQPTTHANSGRFHLPPAGSPTDFYLQGFWPSTRAHSPKTRTTARRGTPRGLMSMPLFLGSLQNAQLPLAGVLLAPVCLLNGP